MATTAAERQKQWYQRQKSGRVVLRIEVDEVRLAAMLADPAIENNFLPHDDPTREELADAVERLLSAMLTRYERDRWGE